jgi:hypothetical protein
MYENFLVCAFFIPWALVAIPSFTGILQEMSKIKHLLQWIYGEEISQI